MLLCALVIHGSQAHGASWPRLALEKTLLYLQPATYNLLELAIILFTSKSCQVSNQN